MSKKSLARLIRIVTGTFGSARDERLSLDSSLTRLEKFVHFWVLVWRSFVRNRCPIRASALSYTTLLALIPMLAVAMSVSSIFLKSQGEDQIGTFIEQFVSHLIPEDLDKGAVPAEDLEAPLDVDTVTNTNSQTTVAPGDTNATVMATHELGATNESSSAATSLARDARVVAAKQKAAAQIRKFIQNTYSGTLGTVGVVVLLWTAIVMLTRIEETFNDIWGVAQGRNWLARVVLYWSTITLGPVLLVGAFGLASGPRFQRSRELLNVVPFLEPIVSQLLPVILISVTFALFYKLMPNTKVHFSAAFIGGLLAGTAWHLFNALSFYLSSRAVNASKIYGSLALVPLIMVGLYVVWVIVLFGAQVAYAFQNRESYLQERLAENVNQRGREFVALRLMTCIGHHFNRGLPPATVPQMSRELGIPSQLVLQVLQTLLAARLVVEVHGIEAGYAPARPLETINCHHILLAMRAAQGQELITREEPVREEVFGEFARIQAAEQAAATSVSMLALVNRAQARLALTSPTTSETAEPGPQPHATVVELTPSPDQPPAPATVAAANLPSATPQPEAPQPAPSPPTNPIRGPEEDQSFPL